MTNRPPDYCRDCWAEYVPGKKAVKRPIAPNSGGRCATHWRVEKKRRKDAAHSTRVERVYGLTAEQHATLLAYQQGKCYICQRATGATRRLSVDHDHQTGYVRGLLCRPCNSVLGHLRDSETAAWRLWMYLRVPPAFVSIGKVKPDG